VAFHSGAAETRGICYRTAAGAGQPIESSAGSCAKRHDGRDRGRVEALAGIDCGRDARGQLTAARAGWRGFVAGAGSAWRCLA
jgi:hypothetical protein